MTKIKRVATRIFGALFVTRDCHLLFALHFGVISQLYATVGQAGGTAFLALMTFAAFPSTELRPTVALNIVAATYSTWVKLGECGERR